MINSNHFDVGYGLTWKQTHKCFIDLFHKIFKGSFINKENEKIKTDSYQLQGKPMAAELLSDVLFLTRNR